MGIKPEDWYFGLPELLACWKGRNLTEHHSPFITNHIGRGEAFMMMTTWRMTLQRTCVISNHHISRRPKTGLHGKRVPASKQAQPLFYTSLCTTSETDVRSTRTGLDRVSFQDSSTLIHCVKDTRKPNNWAVSAIFGDNDDVSSARPKVRVAVSHSSFTPYPIP